MYSSDQHHAPGRQRIPCAISVALSQNFRRYFVWTREPFHCYLIYILFWSYCQFDSKWKGQAIRLSPLYSLVIPIHSLALSLNHSSPVWLKANRGSNGWNINGGWVTSSPSPLQSWLKDSAKISPITINKSSRRIKHVERSNINYFVTWKTQL